MPNLPGGGVEDAASDQNFRALAKENADLATRLTSLGGQVAALSFLQPVAGGRLKVDIGITKPVEEAGKDFTNNVVVNHGVGTTPGFITGQVIGGETGAVFSPKIIARSSTTFTIIFASDVAAGSKLEFEFMWIAIG